MSTARNTRRRSLYMRHALADQVRNKGANASLIVVLVISAFLMATGALVMERLVESSLGC